MRKAHVWRAAGVCRDIRRRQRGPSVPAPPPRRRERWSAAPDRQSRGSPPQPDSSPERATGKPKQNSSPSTYTLWQAEPLRNGVFHLVNSDGEHSRREVTSPPIGGLLGRGVAHHDVRG